MSLSSARRFSLAAVLALAAFAPVSLLAASGIGNTNGASQPLLLADARSGTDKTERTPAEPEKSRNIKVTPAAPAANGTGRRIALVIGNGSYQYPDSLPRLSNPINDAEDMATALKGFGFEVILRKNLSQEAMDQAVAEFGSRIGGSDAALFYFAGHGLQLKNQNYLMPVNSRVESESAVPYQGVNLNRILDEMDNGKSAANIVILDACRNNPISNRFRSGGSRGLSAPGSVPRGTVIVFATDPGNVASDGPGRNGLLTAGLLTAFKGTDLSLDNVLTVASAEVEKASKQAQTPYVNGPKTLQKNFNFRTAQTAAPAVTEQAYWAGIQNSSDPADFEAYLRKYPSGRYRQLAENRLQSLKPPTPEPVEEETPAPVAVMPPSPVPSDAETAFWNEVRANGSRQYYAAYLRQYPRGRYVVQAKAELRKLDELDRAMQQADYQGEQAAWDTAKSIGTAAAYAAFLQQYPSGPYAAQAMAAQQKEIARMDAARTVILIPAVRRSQPPVRVEVRPYPGASAPHRSEPRPRPRRAPQEGNERVFRPAFPRH